MRYLPVYIDIGGHSALVVGADAAAASKVRALIATGARVSVVAPRVTGEIALMAAQRSIRLERRPFVPSDVEGRLVVFAASGIASVDDAVAAAAEAAGVLVNVVDAPGRGRFVMPAIIDRDPITVAVSSAGTSPLLARLVRARIEALLPARLGRLAQFASRFRGAVKATVGDRRRRRRLWERVLSGPIGEAVLSGDEGRAVQEMLSVLNRFDGRRASAGVVFFVGAAGGDAELMTLRALRVLQEAEVLAYDRPLPVGILAYARRDAVRVELGTSGAGEPWSGAVLLDHVRAGRRVVRITADGEAGAMRGAAEGAFLRRHGVRVEVAPAVTTTGAPLAPEAAAGGG